MIFGGTGAGKDSALPPARGVRDDECPSLPPVFGAPPSKPPLASDSPRGTPLQGASWKERVKAALRFTI